MEQNNNFIMDIKIEKCWNCHRKNFLEFSFYPNKLTILQATKILDIYNKYFFQKHNTPIYMTVQYEDGKTEKRVHY